MQAEKIIYATLHQLAAAKPHLVMAIAVLMLASAGKVGAEVTSIADWPCLTWSERRLSGERLDAPQMWLSGYMTGLASAYQVDALAITDAPHVFEWMDQYCEAYPAEPISTGALVMFNDLLARLPKGPVRPL